MHLHAQVFGQQHTSPDGGIGRRAGLKHQWSNPCRFDPGSGYDKTLQVIDFQYSQGFSFCQNLKNAHFWSPLCKGDLKTPQNLLLQGGFPQGGAYGSEYLNHQTMESTF